MTEEDTIMYRLKYAPINLDDIGEVRIGGLAREDAPEFSDGYFSRVEWKDGTPLSNEEIDRLYLEHPDFLYEKVLEALIY